MPAVAEVETLLTGVDLPVRGYTFAAGGIRNEAAIALPRTVIDLELPKIILFMPGLLLTENRIASTTAELIKTNSLSPFKIVPAPITLENADRAFENPVMLYNANVNYLAKATLGISNNRYEEVIARRLIDRLISTDIIDDPDYLPQGYTGVIRGTREYSDIRAQFADLLDGKVFALLALARFEDPAKTQEFLGLSLYYLSRWLNPNLFRKE
jgi:hypothetical protein